MRKISRVALIYSLVIASIGLHAQQSVAIGTSTPDPAAVLLLVGNGNQGLIIPTTSNAQGIVKKAGMIVFNTTDSKVYYCDGTDWAPISGGVNGTDSQTLTINGNIISISNGNSQTISGAPPTTIGQVLVWDGGKWTATAAAVPSTNQVLMWNGTTWAPTTLASGGTVTSVIGGTGLTGGTITTTGTLAVNVGTAAGQIPQLDAGGKLNTSVIPGTVDANAADDITTATAAAGDLAGTYPNPTIGTSKVTSAHILDGSIAAADLNSMGAINSGQVLQWNGTAWAPATLAATSFGNLTTTTGGVTITGGIGAVAGSGSTVNIQNATASQPGLLTAANFTTFNNKVSSVTGSSTITVGGTATAPTISLSNTTVTAGSYGSASQVPQLTIDAQGRITAVTLATIPAGGDMLKTTYDTNTDNIVDAAATAAALSTTLPLTSGGTGATTAAAARTNLGLGTLATASTITSAEITDATIAAADLNSMSATSGQVLQYNGTVWAPVTLAPGGDMLKTTYDVNTDNIVDAAASLTTTLPLTIGGTGATTAAAARTNLGLGSLSTLNSVTNAEITDASVTGTDIALSTITNANISPSAAITVDKLAPGTNGQVLTTSGGVPAWATSSGLSNALPIGQMFVGNASNIAVAAPLTGDAALNFNLGNAILTIGTGVINSNKILDGTVAGIDLAAGSVSGGAGGVITDASITGTDIALSTITNANIIAAAGITVDKLASGTNGQVLTTTGGVPTWATGFTNPMTSPGDMIYGGAGGTASRLVGAVGLLKSNGTTPTWGSVNLASTDVSGTLLVANGGTNSTATPTNGGVAYGTGTAYAFSTVGTSGQILQSNGAAAPTWINVPPPSGSAGGDLTGTYPNPTISGTAATGVNIITAVNASAGSINGARVNPAFGTQNISTTGTLTSGNNTTFGAATTTWPASNAAGVLTNNGTGTLSWGPAGATTLDGLTDATVTSPTTGQLLVHNGAGQFTNVIMSGDATINNTGVMTIAAGAISGGTAGDITDATITDADINGAAAIAGTKLIPNFGSQNITTSGTLTATTGLSAGTTNFTVDNTGNITKINNVVYSFPSTGPAGVLTNDGAGILSWAASSGWGLTGNNISASPTNFIGTTSSNALLFSTNTSGGGGERMRIDANGLVGIGTTTPNNPLSVQGNMNIDNGNAYNATINNTLRFGSGTDAAIGGGAFGGGRLDLFTLGSPRLTINNTGNVGIGTTAPTELLHINGTSIPKIRLTNTVTGSTATDGFEMYVDGAGDSYIQTKEAGNMLIMGANGNNVVHLTPGGLMGLNNNSPTAGLDLFGNIRVDDGTAAVGKVLTAIDASGLANWQAPSFTAPLLVPAFTNAFEYSGNNSVRLTVNNSTLSYEFGELNTANNVFAVNWQTGNAYHTGKVGIGMTSPLSMLDVVSSSATNAIAGSVNNSLYAAVYGVQNDASGSAIVGQALGAGGRAGTFTGGDIGVYASGGNFGVTADATGSGGAGVVGSAGAVGGRGIYGSVYGAATQAGFFIGDVQVIGNLSKSAGTFKIDHPQDPENKYLVHSFVESPDMMNVYNGNISTGGDGVATVDLPSYFSALNKDFRYQLTVIGEFAQAIVFEEINGNSFKIKTDKPNIKVSWQVTGVRKDPYAEQNRIVPEVDKKGEEIGKYLTPSAYGKSDDLQIGKLKLGKDKESVKKNQDF